MPSILFVCTANRFRSAIAAAIFKKALEEDYTQGASYWNRGDSKDWKVGSAGMRALDGQPVLPEVLETAEQLGIDLSGHRSTQLNGSLLLEYDLILVMEENHKATLMKEFPYIHERVYLLSHVVEMASYDVPDPHGSNQEVTGVIAGMNELIRRNLRYICILAIALHNKRKRL